MPQFDQWQEMWKGLGVSVPNESLFQALIACYSEPHRRYHTTQHLDECLAKLREIRVAATHPEEIELALWFHDAIYDVRRQDNEEKSAEWARSTVLRAGLPVLIAERVHAMVMATRHDAVPTAPDERILVDVDLSILGADTWRFAEYECQIREEYSWVPDILFRPKRQRVLKEFLERPRIFSTEQFFNAYEAKARANLRRSIEQL